MNFDVLHQWDRRWRGLTLGHGPATFWGGACVMFALIHAARYFKTSPALDPPHANEIFRQAGAFRSYNEQTKQLEPSDELLVHVAAPTIGLVAPLEERVVGKPGDEALQQALINAEGAALLRVSCDGSPKGVHTVFAYDAIATEGGALELALADSCAADGRERMAWPDLTARVKWSDTDTRRYTVVGVRPIRRKEPAVTDAASTGCTLPG